MCCCKNNVKHWKRAGKRIGKTLPNLHVDDAWTQWLSIIASFILLAVRLLNIQRTRSKNIER